LVQNKILPADKFYWRGAGHAILCAAYVHKWRKLQGTFACNVCTLARELWAMISVWTDDHFPIPAQDASLEVSGGIKCKEGRSI
jgi:hypothetical protein